MSSINSAAPSDDELLRLYEEVRLGYASNTQLAATERRAKDVNDIIDDYTDDNSQPPGYERSSTMPQVPAEKGACFEYSDNAQVKLISSRASGQPTVFYSPITKGRQTTPEATYGCQRVIQFQSWSSRYTNLCIFERFIYTYTFEWHNITARRNQ